MCAAFNGLNKSVIMDTFAPKTALCNKIVRKCPMLCIVRIYTLPKLLHFSLQSWMKKEKQISEGHPVLPVSLRLN